MFNLTHNQGNINEHKSKIIFTIHKASQNVKLSISSLTDFQMTGLTTVHMVLPLRKEERVGNRVYNGLCNILFLLKHMEANTTNADICNTGQWVHGLLPSASLCFSVCLKCK